MEKIRKAVKTSLNKIMPGILPGFLIVGAQKSGTTALHYYLNQHPLLLGSRPKEVNYFNDDSNYNLGTNWYRKSFINLKKPFGKVISFEASPEYLYNSVVPKRINTFNPDMKIIIILRNPVRRSFSAWNMYKYFKERPQGPPRQLLNGYIRNLDNNLYNELYERESFPSFEECVTSELSKILVQQSRQEPSFIRRGIYYPQIKRYIDLFGKEQVLVLGFKDLIGEQRRNTLNEILNFIGVESSDWEFLKDEKRNSRNYEIPLNDHMKKRLKDFYQPHNEQLFNYLQKVISW